MTGNLVKMATTNLSDLAACRRYTAQVLRDDAWLGGVLIEDARPNVRVYIGPGEWHQFARGIRSVRPSLGTVLNPFEHLEQILSDVTARHTDEDPGVIVFVMLPVSDNPGPDPGGQGITYVPVDRVRSGP